MSRSVYIIGSKGIPAKYGGFETFVDKLTECNNNKKINYNIACLKENSEKSAIFENVFEYNNATCYNINVPNIGPGKAILYDVLALKYAIELSKEKNDKHPVFYVLACRIGPFIKYFKKAIQRLNGELYINPDGHEWLREKWSKPVRKYWKISEKLMIKNADLVICDSKSIEKYIINEYRQFNPQTTYIAYGTDLTPTKLHTDDLVVKEWMKDKKIFNQGYYLVVGRFVPENNYELIIEEFMKCNSKRDLVIITNVEKNAFYEKILSKTNFNKDPRIKFVGTVYNQELLKYLRENAYGYIHGHEVGGTNPSLLEALRSTKINLLLDVGFNKEVGRDSAIYWNKDSGNLCELLDQADYLNQEEIEKLASKSSKLMEEHYTWESIVRKYDFLFTK
ncbi:DUF1972 domain-containing protein [Enterococcus casseliflavus]|uniref:beta 1-4 rhamnosyltransferase Cps2T n=1 Tax=Enterococcus casseliflavus TaxID=37734 RepID=UPI0023311FCA|nr:DUF1972 domain-containing protein [Enterococcus casseliflavus]MDB1694503.1 DUF1972 domain-containing protein [Enterococcus casseliflavus]MDB1697937.1 DUF1972 domain-containing protein [Enterococcus casseliflavus]MDB1702999.1 DUF1972 domain-containing protein [Enterococcus casseliflavus]MDB1704200.1 DUF1972 domain-containing protein [Enterococcus casseliflavus]